MNIYEKLIEVRKSVPYLKKDNEGYQFKYVSSSQTLGALREAMDKQKLLLVPVVVDSKVTSSEKQMLTELSMEFTWINAEKPEEKITCKWYGQGIDTREQGVGKAMTYAEKYFMLKFFNVPTDKADPDSFQKKPEPAKQQQPNQDRKRQSSTGPGSERLITGPQSKRIFAKRKTVGLLDAPWKEFLKASYSIESSKQIQVKDYDVICAWIDRYKKSNAARPARESLIAEAHQFCDVYGDERYFSILGAAGFEAIEDIADDAELQRCLDEMKRYAAENQTP